MEHDFCKVCGKNHTTGQCTDTETELRELLDRVDRNVLGSMTEEASEQGALYGRGFELDVSRREQLEIITRATEILLDSDKNSPEWGELQRLIQEGGQKGVLSSLIRNEDGAPTWLVNGGKETSVRKTRIGEGKGRSAISVPERLYRIYILDEDAQSVAGVAKTDSKTLYGRSPKTLATKLNRLSGFFKANKLLK